MDGCTTSILPLVETIEIGLKSLSGSNGSFL